MNSLDKPLLKQLKDIHIEPIFILGDHRSGTTLLYQTLASTQCFNVVKAYHVIKYDEILYNFNNNIEKEKIKELQNEFDQLGIGDREFDSVPVSPELPEEYGFIIRNAGHELFINDESLQTFLEACHKIQFTSNQEKPLLLKNPWCYPHFLYIHQVIPNARFIFIHRNPIHVINSKLKTVDRVLSDWNAYTGLVSKRYNKIFKNPIFRLIYRAMYFPRFNIGLNKVLKQSIESTSYFIKHIHKLPDSAYISIRFEDLCEQPEITLQQVFQFLNTIPMMPIDYKSLINKRPTILMPTVANNQKRIAKDLAPYLELQNYSG
ncbi:MAG: sulfotransferase [Leptolyngbya sp. SIO3F4]|nr:sulfotransferase [Leptolyngbya sp. SIO3F4]